MIMTYESHHINRHLYVANNKQRSISISCDTKTSEIALGNRLKERCEVKGKRLSPSAHVGVRYLELFYLLHSRDRSSLRLDLGSCSSPRLGQFFDALEGGG